MCAPPRRTQARALALGLAVLAGLCAARDAGADPPVPAAGGVQETPAALPWWHWLNPVESPFFPIPEIITDPNSGTTVGLLPTWLITDSQHHVDRIIAPDVQYNSNFGWGAHARLLEYPSPDVQWSAVAGASEHIQRKIDLEFLRGRLRLHRWSFSASALYIRDGTPRYYGLGNSSPAVDATNYTQNQSLVQVTFGRNFTPAWQLAYTLRLQQVDVLAGTLPGIYSIQTLFPGTLGTTGEVLNRLSLIYDTRDDVTLPTRGMRWIAYGGIAGADVFGATRYTEAGLDGSAYWALTRSTILATHFGLRYMPSVRDAAFWELSSLGGGSSIPGGQQQLRGFGAGRFTDHNVFSATAELRQNVFSLNLFRTRIDFEAAPFIDVGRVFADTGTSPFSQLHKVYGIGFRGIARPFVVGYVDVGYGSEGTAVFTGVSYPF